MLQLMKPDSLGECVIRNPMLSNNLLGSMLKGTLYNGNTGWKVTRYDTGDVYWFTMKRDALERVRGWWGAP